MPEDNNPETPSKSVIDLSVGIPVPIDRIIENLRGYHEKGFSVLIHHLVFKIDSAAKVIDISPNGHEALMNDNRRLRRMLAHALSPGLVKLYTDDGEIQGYGATANGAVTIDFKRDPIDRIRDAIMAMNHQRLVDQAKDFNGA